MSLLKIHEKYDKEFKKVYAEYVDLHKQLDAFRGIPIDDELAAKVNPIIVAIQERYIDMECYIEDTIHRYQFCAKTKLDFQEFVNHVRAGGEVNNEAQS